MRNNSFSETHATEWQKGTHSQFSRSREQGTDPDLDTHCTFAGDNQNYLILRHNHSGSLYCSKIPDKLSPENYFGDTDQDLELEMPTGPISQPCFLRWFLTLLHVTTCLVSGFCFIFSLIGTLFCDHCLPYLVNKDGSQIKSQFGFGGLCEGVIFGLGFVFVVSLIMCGMVQCSLNKTPMVVFSLFLTTCMGACSIMGGSMFTIHYALWCDSISQNLGARHVGCAYAAAQFDRVHSGAKTTAFQTEMELQQITAWTLVPLTSITLLCYALAMRWGGMRAADEDAPPPRGFYQYLARQSDPHREARRPADTGESDEKSPFLHRQN